MRKKGKNKMYRINKKQIVTQRYYYSDSVDKNNIGLMRFESRGVEEFFKDFDLLKNLKIKDWFKLILYFPVGILTNKKMYTIKFDTNYKYFKCELVFIKQD